MLTTKEKQNILYFFLHKSIRYILFPFHKNNNEGSSNIRQVYSQNKDWKVCLSSISLDFNILSFWLTKTDKWRNSVNQYHFINRYIIIKHHHVWSSSHYQGHYYYILFILRILKRRFLHTNIGCIFEKGNNFFFFSFSIKQIPYVQKLTLILFCNFFVFFILLF